MMNNMKMGVYTHNDEIFNFNFRTNLSVVDKLKFVNSVTSLVVTDNYYNSVIRDLVFDFYIVDIMTDVDTEDLKESSTFLNDVEQFLYATNIVEIIKSNAPSLIDELNKAVDNSIAYLTGIHFNPLNDALTSLLNTIEEKFKEVDIESAIGVMQKFASMTGELTPDSIVNAYMNSDAHMNNLAEIEESKKQMAEIAVNLDNAIKETNKK